MSHGESVISVEICYSYNRFIFVSWGIFQDFSTDTKLEREDLYGSPDDCIALEKHKSSFVP